MSVAVDIADAVGRLTLDRQEVANAFDDSVISGLRAGLDRLTAEPAVRVIVIGAAGKHFSAGADLAWMQRMAGYSREENLADAMALARLLQAIDTCPKPVVARVQGTAIAGALGLIAAADIAIAAEHASFAVSEVRLGLIPAVISPYVVRAVGARTARRWFLTAERFPAEAALAAGLIHEAVPADGLDTVVEAVIGDLLKGSPAALAAAKRLVATVDRPLDTTLIEETARLIAEARAGEDAREGLAAFFAKRKPRWQR